MSSTAQQNPADILMLAREQLPRLYNLAAPYTVTLLKYSENCTFIVEDTAGKKIFRVNRPNYHPLKELDSEVVWMDMLRKDTGLILPEVIPGKDKKFIQQLISDNCNGVYYCSMFSYMPGTIAKNLSGDELLNKTAGIGKIAAELHRYSMSHDLQLKRFEWSFEALFGENPRWGDWRGYAGLSAGNCRLFDDALSVIGQRLRQFGKSGDRYGLIHSDLHLSNIIIDEGKLQVIDFDDCGYGWYLYDLGCTLVEYSDGLEALTVALVNGYQSIRPLSDAEKDEITTFILMRRLLRLAWLSSHADSDTAKNVGNGYLAKTVELSEKFLTKNSRG